MSRKIFQFIQILHFCVLIIGARIEFLKAIRTRKTHFTWKTYHTNETKNEGIRIRSTLNWHEALPLYDNIRALALHKLLNLQKEHMFCKQLNN